MLAVVLVIMRLLFHVDKYDDDKLIGLCVKDQVHPCTLFHYCFVNGPVHLYLLCLSLLKI